MRLRKRNLFYLLAFTSAIIGALVATIDTVIGKLYIQDAWALGLACFLVGVPVSLFITLILSISTKSKSIGGKH